MADNPSDSSGAFAHLLSGDQASLARAISLIERGGMAADRLSLRLLPHTGNARIVAVTGPPGAGKSTLVDSLTAHLRMQGEKVAVLAVDPSSPITGGAVLGDRVRMGRHSQDGDVFIRSLANHGHLGGLSAAIGPIIHAVDAAGWSVIILETVGAGQSETEVAEHADVKVVVNAPGLGDDVQAIKAGILEIADILVVNKADLPDAGRTLRQLQAMLKLRGGEGAQVPVLSTTASSGEGISALADALAAAFVGQRVDEKRSERAQRSVETAIRNRAHDLLRSAFGSQDAMARALSQRVEQATLTLDEAALEWLTQAVAHIREGKAQ